LIKRPDILLKVFLLLSLRKLLKMVKITSIKAKDLDGEASYI
jgi:hypothetical protein